ncbi:MAG TPA: FmdB family transcriptional regulator, partial [Bacteroidetes bacterium]|nr:FmdB family transcriptional regulator [Bacteroidota bacterium]
MPSYDYKCRECGYTFEEFQSMKSDLLSICPACGKPALKRLMAGGVGMIFKGSGFYLTDYKKTGSSSSSSPSSSSSGASPTSKESKDSKDSKDSK